MDPSRFMQAELELTDVFLDESSHGGGSAPD